MSILVVWLIILSVFAGAVSVVVLVALFCSLFDE